MAEDSPARRDVGARPARQPHEGSGAETGYAVIGTLISGMAVWGGVGWLLDQWWDMRVFFPVGIILGMAVAIYLVVARFAPMPPLPGDRRTGNNPGGRRSRPRTQKGQR
jgi:F0F1-type ATP synthase assembly protein I